MARVQLALNVADLEESIAFYRRLFGVEPAKRRDGYANFAISDPPLKLVLFEGAGRPGTLNHLGVETATSDEVAQVSGRARTQGLAASDVEEQTCCYARQDKAYVDGPDDLSWEVYTVLEDAEAGCACC